MRAVLDPTHDPTLRSWVDNANGHSDFPIQNLPLGVFRPRAGEAQGGVAIGEHILSLRLLAESGVVDGDALVAAKAGSESTLNRLMVMGSRYRMALRLAVSALLAESTRPRPELLFAAEDCELLLPASIGDYTDFYAGIVHAEAVGRLFRPDNPLLPNYKWIPVGYHGRSSSIRLSGEAVRRPRGQSKAADQAAPTFGAAKSLDFEMELGIWIGPGNELGRPIPIDEAGDSIAGYCLLNDWSARDVQAWEYQPLGPFLAKSFQTTISGWVVTPEALVPFRRPQAARSEGDPQPLPYLYSEADQAAGALTLELEVFLLSPEMRRQALAPHRLTRSYAESLFWTPAQLVTHHASNGCNLRPGDLLGTGTISSPSREGCGSLLELTRNGAEPVTLPSGETRTFLLDGDEVLLRARARRAGYVSIGFGVCRAMVLPAYT